MTLNLRNLERWTACGIALTLLVIGSVAAGRFFRTSKVRADSNRVFELRVYHALPGKVSTLEARFRDKTSKILARHNLTVVGYWVSSDSSTADNDFIWVVAYPTLEEGKRNWDAMLADPEFQELIKEEQVEKLVEKVDKTYMRPTDFSAIK